LVLLLGTLLAAPAHAQPAAPTASADNGFSNLTARWWTWVTAQPAVKDGDTNTFPILDTTGKYAAVDQESGIGPANKYFFLVGTFGGPATRNVTVPRGKALFFPIVALETDNAVSPLPPTPFKVPELKKQAKDVIDTTTEHTATFDGKSVDTFRVTSPVFDYTVPAKDSFYAFNGQTGPQFEGTIRPAVSDGYWSYIPPPTPGSHVLKFKGVLTGLTVEVTYNLTVR
jgi:hypothetical protein